MTVKADTLRSQLEALLKALPHAQTDKLLRDVTTMHVGGRADAYCEVHSTTELIDVVKIVSQLDYPFRIIGSGSNVVFADEGYQGLIIRNIAQEVAILTDENAILADSGITVARMLNEAAVRELGGMEYFAGLPGTVGGALYGNAECWGHAISEFLERATLLIPVSGAEPKLLAVESDWFSYRYRSSKLKRMPNTNEKPVILNARFHLRKKPKEAILAGMKEYRDKRFGVHQPIGRFCSGSFFQNPGGSSHGVKPLEPAETAGYLIDHSGGKKLKSGDAIVSKEHANFIVNQGQATAQDIRTLAEEIKATVHTTFGVDLHEEIEYLGNWSSQPTINALTPAEGTHVASETDSHH